MIVVSRSGGRIPWQKWDFVIAAVTMAQRLEVVAVGYGFDEVMQTRARCT